MPVEIEKRCANCKRMLPVTEFPWHAIAGVTLTLTNKTRGRFCHECVVADPDIYETDAKPFDEEWEQLTFDWDNV